MDSLRRELDEATPRFQEAVDLVTTHVRYLLRRYGLIHRDEVNHRVTGRVKTVDRCIAKIKRVEKREQLQMESLRDVERHIDDLAGIRVVCPYLTDVALVYGYICRHRAFREIPNKFEDYIAEAKSGYRGLHTVVRTSTSSGTTKCEVQMRTGLQDAWAVKSHALVYKLKKTEFERLPLELRHLLIQQSDSLYNEDKNAVSIAALVKKYVKIGSR